jgi:nucleoside-diphosphate-sugar epimerase
MQKTVLVTGGAGFIGSNVVRELLSRNMKVIVLDDLCTGLNNIEDINDTNLIFIRGDIRNIDLVDSLMSKCNYVINEACRVIAASLDDPYGDLDVNGRGTLILLESAKKHNIEAFIYASSASVYGDTEGIVMSEDLVPDPSNPYAISKMTGEHYTKLYSKVHGMNTVSLRYFNVYGPHQNPHSVYGGVVPIYCEAIKEEQPLRIYGDGLQTRDFTYVKDVSRITVNCLFDDKAFGGVYNVGYGAEVSIVDLVWAFHQIKDTGVTYEESRTIDNVYRRESCTEKLESDLGYRCKTNLKDGIEVTYNWYAKDK